MLTTKLFCGHCQDMMVGHGGTGKSGKHYRYYSCRRAKKQLCDKQIVSKQYIEDRVVEECLKLLTEDNIKFIAKQIADECNKSTDNQTIKQLKKAIQDADTAIENLWIGIEQGQSVQMLTERLNKRQAEREELEIQLAIELNKRITLSEGQILAFLDYVCEMPIEDINKKRALINIFVHSVYLYDDHFTLIVNASNKPLSIDHIPLEEIHTSLESLPPEEQCSTLKNVAPPRRRKLCIACDDFFCCASKSSRAHAAAPPFQIEPAMPGFDLVLKHIIHNIKITQIQHWVNTYSSP